MYALQVKENNKLLYKHNKPKNILHNTDKKKIYSKVVKRPTIPLPAIGQELYV